MCSDELIDKITASLESLYISLEITDCFKLSQKLDEYISKTPDIKPDVVRVFELLSQVCSMRFKETDVGHYELAPYLITSRGTSFTPEMLSDDDVECLFKLQSSLHKILMLKARIADVIWVHKKKHRFEASQQAISAYIDFACSLKTESKPICESLVRAYSIAVELGTAGKDKCEQVIQKSSEYIAKVDSMEINGYHSRLLRSLAQSNCAPRSELLDVSILFAEKALESGNSLIARNLLETALSFIDDDPEKVVKVKNSISKSYVTEAESATSSMAKSHFLKQAIGSYQRFGMHEKARALHPLLREAQSGIIDEMHTIQTGEMDIMEIVQSVEDHVSGKSLYEALLRLAFIIHPVNITSMIPAAEKEAKNRGILQIVTPIYVDNNGRTPSMPKGCRRLTEDEATEHQLHENVIFQIHSEVTTVIAPAVTKVCSEHVINSIILYNFVKNHPFVPNGYESYYARGLAAGLSFDFPMSSLLLIPQLENSLRHIIIQKGGVVETVEADGGQKLKNIDSVLDDPIIENYFGKDDTILLKCLLVNPRYGNLRHSIAHGLLPYESLASSTAVYLWWFILRIIFSPFLKYETERLNNRTSEADGNRTA